LFFNKTKTKNKKKVSSEDFCADTGIVRTPSLHTLLYARSALVTTACAHGLQSIDLVCLDYKDEGILVNIEIK